MKPPSQIRRFLRHPSGAVGLALLLFFVALALAAPYLFPQGPYKMVARPMLWPGQNPDLLLGTDSLGRDLLVSVVYGARVSLLVGLSAALASAIVGAAVGLVSGYFGGWIGDMLMRITDAFQTLPSFLAAILIVGLIGPSIGTIVTSIALVSWPMVARLVRAEVLRIKTLDFVQACRIMGMPDWRIMLAEILPNSLGPIIVATSLLVANAIIIESGLSFLGLGDPNMMSWGGVIGNGRSALRMAWYITMIPAGAVVLTVLALNLIGDALNDVLNPRLRKG
ncbi:ABC transporter permease [Salipiger abyssi]|uniref:Peptide/nickel transport system permease protein n=1 Tax=Salipiger abyssi TaxID=1250539 RepID=A0A1P8UMG0_9RHOB|nr:ABC transporter permease [Salipiger abyssi]APZ50589.1 peptide/nickel transport system permease protein [Salipiger abyssi]